MTTVSIIIPTLNAGPRFAAVLDRLQRQRIDAAVELLIIDSSSQDATVAAARRAGARVEVIERAHFNHGRTRHRAIEQSAGEFIVLLSQDALPADEFLLARLCENYADPLVAGAFARHQARPEHGSLVQRHVSQWSGSRVRQESFIDNRAAYDQMPGLQRLAFCRFDNVCSCVRRSAWQAHPFAARDFAEDLDWSKRVLEAGWKIVYDPRALVIHSHSFSLWQQYRRTWQTHQSLRELFGLRLISHRRELPGHFWRHMRAEVSAIGRNSGGIGGTVRDILAVPLRSACTVLATYRGARTAAASPRAKALVSRYGT